jgi:Bacterial extracellular solute-binding proteins, family 5 Middle
MSRPSISETPMTGAERQARYRAARADGAPVVRVRRPADRRSRIQRWRDAVSTLTNLQTEYARWLEALPDNQRDGTTAEALQAIVELDLSELETIEPPRFHDREPVLARDCVASISCWMKRDAPVRTLALRLDALEALDDQTVVFRLKKPFSQLPFILAKTMPNLLTIMPARLAATDPAQPVNELVGSGPYRFVANEFSTNSLAVLARFEAYQPRDEPPSGTSGGRIAKMDRIEWRVIPEAATQVNALLTGEVDWIGAVPPDLNPLVRRNPNIVVEVIDPFGLYPFVRPNHVSGPTANVGSAARSWRLSMAMRSLRRRSVTNPAW